MQPKQFTCLTIHQPWASLVVQGAKRVENRRWPTWHRGLLLIHAGRSREWFPDDDDCDAITDAGIVVPSADSVPYGAIIGAVSVVDCVRLNAVADDEQTCPLAWLHNDVLASGPFCWVLNNPVLFAQPIPCPGQTKLWYAPEHLSRQIAKQMELSSI
jgi:hypothetical protein